MRVEARSAIQAQAIMRRRGYEMAVDTAMRVSGESDFVGPAQIRPLACARCGYALSGLTIDRASVTCPECAYPQALIVWDPENQGQHRQAHWIVYVFAAIGGLFTLLIALLIIGVFL
jgi:predicted Zn-ribbon and HTH transcriptional regulator